MIYKQEYKEGYLLITLVGSLDSAGAADVETRFNALAGYNVEKVIVDMTKVDFISSVGMGLLLNHAKNLAKVGHSMKYFGLQNKVRQVLETAGILKLLEVRKDLADCVASLK